jgi:hypothetical protein
MRKPFDKQLYKKYDQLAKSYAESLFPDYEVEEHKRKTHVDLVIKKNGEILFYIETEIKTYIKDGLPFSYSTLNIPSRKFKFCNLDKPTLFILFSETGKTYFCVWDKFVRESPLEEVQNRYVRRDELFFKVDIKKHVDDNIQNALRRHWRQGK